MSVVRTLIGNVKGPQGDTGATGAQGVQGEAATVNVGSVSTTAYGNAAQVTNVGTENDAILNFVIPQGKPGEKTTTMSGLTLDTVTTSADEFPVPAVSENGSTVWGKVIKFFQDTVAALTGKLDANKIVNSQAVTESGYGLDALQANPSVSGSLAAQISDLNDSLTNNTLYGGAVTSGITFQYCIRGNIVFCSFHGTPTATTITFEAPKALLGYHEVVLQWSGVAQVDVFIDQNLTTITLRNLTVNKNFLHEFSYPMFNGSV